MMEPIAAPVAIADPSQAKASVSLDVGDTCSTKRLATIMAGEIAKPVMNTASAIIGIEGASRIGIVPSPIHQNVMKTFMGVFPGQ